MSHWNLARLPKGAVIRSVETDLIIWDEPDGSSHGLKVVRDDSPEGFYVVETVVTVSPDFKIEIATK